MLLTTADYLIQCLNDESFAIRHLNSMGSFYVEYIYYRRAAFKNILYVIKQVVILGCAEMCYYSKNINIENVRQI